MFCFLLVIHIHLLDIHDARCISRKVKLTDLKIFTRYSHSPFGHSLCQMYFQKSEIDRPQDGVAAPVEKALSLDLAQHLLSASVQGAVAKIQDGTYANGRSTHRIAVLLHWLEDRGKCLFGVI